MKSGLRDILFERDLGILHLENTFMTTASLTADL
jgi:hypothetical protein